MSLAQNHGEHSPQICVQDHQRENRIVEFEEGRRIAWLPSPVGEAPPGHLWRWELQPQGEDLTLLRHTYDWTALTDQARIARARATTSASLLASIERLAALVGQTR